MNVRVGTLVCSLASVVTTGCFLAGNYEVAERVEGSHKSDDVDEDTTDETRSEDESTGVSLLGPDAATSDTTTPDETQSAGESSTDVTTEPAGTSIEPDETSTDPSSTTLSVTSTAPETSTHDPADAGATAEPPVEPECPKATTYDSEYEACVHPCGDDGVRGLAGRCYWIGGEDSEVAWAPVPDLCAERGEGWTALSVRSQEEHEFVSSLLEADTWLGARDTAPNTWKWVDDDTTFWRGAANGQPANEQFTAWGKGEPSAANDESCARYHETNEGTGWTWSDCSCGPAAGGLLGGGPKPPGSNDKDVYRPACKGPEALSPL